MKKALRVMIICMLCIIIGACFVACGDNTMQGGGSARLLDFVGLRFEGETFEYDGTEHRIEVKGAPADATIVYKNNAVTEVGEYTATATVSKEGYNSKTLSAKIVVMPSAKLLVSARFRSRARKKRQIAKLRFLSQPCGHRGRFGYHRNGKRQL